EQKRHRSLRSFQLYLGYGYTKQQSGDGMSMKLGGSDICRTHLFAWTKACVIPQRNDVKWLNKALNKEMKPQANNKKFNTLEQIKDSDQKLKQKINRLNFKITRMLFYELANEII
ncbi:MAG: hypothetical protein SFU25_06475, partial [Candidatus Caenarcaniphilales bacterium]|nr:hypothetical protein [Candidatus Caenarcaniphilales bacterium]